MDKLTQLRKDNKKTQANIASHLGLTQQAYAAYENNKAVPPSDIIIKLADYFGVSTDYLLGREYKQNSEQKMTEKQKQLLQLLQQLDNDEMAKVIDYAALIKQARK